MVGYGVTAVGIGMCDNAVELSIAFELISKRLNIIDDGISISWIDIAGGGRLNQRADSRRNLTTGLPILPMLLVNIFGDKG